MKDVLVHQGDTTGLYPEYMTKRGGYFSFRYPKFPKYVVVSTEDSHDNEELYAYQKKVWLRLAWKSQSKHQTHYQWCLNNMIRNGAYLHVRHYWGSDYANKSRIQVVYIRQLAGDCDVAYIDPLDEDEVKGELRAVGLQPSDYRLSLSTNPINKADVYYNNPRAASSARGDEVWNHLPAWGDEEDPQQPFGKTIEDQCVWLHRLCQICPGAIILKPPFKLYGTQEVPFKIYGAWLEENALAVAGHDGGSGPLQKKVLPLDTTFEICGPNRLRHKMDSDYQAFRQ